MLLNPNILRFCRGLTPITQDRGALGFQQQAPVTTPDDRGGKAGFTLLARRHRQRGDGRSFEPGRGPLELYSHLSRLTGARVSSGQVPGVDSKSAGRKTCIEHARHRKRQGTAIIFGQIAVPCIIRVNPGTRLQFLAPCLRGLRTRRGLGRGSNAGGEDEEATKPRVHWADPTLE